MRAMASLAGRGNARRPARLPRVERERQMLSVAHGLFAERGYAAVTMDDVAARVGVTKPLLYNYFGNKERLYIACMEPAGEALVGDRRRGRRRQRRRRRGARAPVCAHSSPSSTPTAPRGACSSTRRSRAAARSREQVAEYRERIARARRRLAARPAPPARSGPREIEVRRDLDRRARRRGGAGALVARDRGALRSRRPRELLIATLEPGLRSRAAARGVGRASGPPDGRQRAGAPLAAVLGGNRIPFARSNGAYARRVQPGHAHRDARRPDRALRARRASASARSPRARSSSIRATSTSRASACSAPRSRPRRPPTTCSRPAAPAWRRRSWSPTRSRSGRSRSASRAASTRPPTRRSRSTSELREILLRRQPRELDAGELRRSPQPAPAAARARDPAQRGAAHGPVDGRALRDHGRASGGSAARQQDELAVAQPPQPRRRLRARLPGRPRDARTAGLSATRTCARTRRSRSSRG